MDPVTLAILGGGASIASMFLNDKANSAVNDARAGVLNAERGRQAALDAEAKGVTDRSLGRYVNFDTGMADRAKTLSDFYRTPVVTPNTPYTLAPLPPTSSDLVSREIANKSGIAANYVDNQADALGKLRSFGDYLGSIGRGVARDTGEVGQIGNFKKGSSAVTQYELDDANRAGNSYKFFGDLLGGLGKVGLTAGLSGSLAPTATASGGITGAAGPTSVGGAPLVAPQPSIFTSGAAPFLTYGRR